MAKYTPTVSKQFKSRTPSGLTVRPDEILTTPKRRHFSILGVN
jgi:hypothetical protein